MIYPLNSSKDIDDIFCSLETGALIYIPIDPSKRAIVIKDRNSCADEVKNLVENFLNRSVNWNSPDIYGE